MSAAHATQVSRDRLTRVIYGGEQQGLRAGSSGGCQGHDGANPSAEKACNKKRISSGVVMSGGNK